MSCIFCKSEDTLPSLEHIVPESMGNKNYVLPKGHICKSCNNLFSKFEKEVLSSTIIGFERARFATSTKKGKSSFSKVGSVKMEGTEKENIITISGVNKEDIRTVDTNTKTFQIFVPGFQGNEMPTAKFLLKVGYQSMYKSKRRIFQKYNYSDLIDYMMNRSNIDWPFVTIQKEINKFYSVPSFTDKYQLNKCHCSLLFNQLNDQTLLFRFVYGGFKATINLLNRNIEWLKEYKSDDNNQISIYPTHVKKNL